MPPVEEGSVAVAAVFEPVEQPTTVEETVERLGTAVRLGLLAPGSRLPPERDLALNLQIARSTLRQALQVLVESGHLVATRDLGGVTFVAAEPPVAAGSARPVGSELRAVLDMRAAIELGAVALAAERASDADLDALDGHVETMAAADAFDVYRRADIRFHLGLAEAARSPRLIAAMTDVQAEMSELIALIAHPETVLIRSNAQHRRLVGVLRRRDAAAALRLTREHIAGTEHVLIGLLPKGSLGESDHAPALDPAALAAEPRPAGGGRRVGTRLFTAIRRRA